MRPLVSRHDCSDRHNVSAYALLKATGLALSTVYARPGSIRSVRAAGQRHRAVDQIAMLANVVTAVVTVTVVVIGVRKEGDKRDVYRVR